MIYKIPILLTSFFLLFSACSTVKDSNSTNEELTNAKLEVLEKMDVIEKPFNVEIQITERFPYCGGAANVIKLRFKQLIVS